MVSSFQTRLKELRREYHITQPELAEKIGVSKGMISFWENGQCEPTSNNIIKLAEFFSVSTDYLLGIID